MTLDEGNGCSGMKDGLVGLLESTPLIERVQGVLPALNIRPESLPMSPNLVRRMRARQEGRLALGGVERLLVYVGDRPSRNADDEAAGAAETALKTLPPSAREVCEQLVVVWDDLDGEPQVAAFSVTADGQVGDLLGASWLDPRHWSDPMIDASVTPQEAFEGALASVRDSVESSPTNPAAGQDLRRAVRLLDLALLAAGGEGQNAERLPDAGDSPDERAAWFARYEASVRDEWDRVQGRLASTRVRAAPAHATGPIYGTRVFVSYARPDSTALARPVVEALRSQGADVWFDQEEELATGLLNEGLGQTIQGCDAYVLCASNEFFERAGYATQELAWALEQVGTDAGLRGLAVVAAPGTVLPRLTAGWPVVELPPAYDQQGLAAILADAIGVAVTTEVEPPALHGPTAAAKMLPASEVDADGLLVRVRHRNRLFELPISDLGEIVVSRARDARTKRLAALLRDVGGDLDWDGHLARHSAWPGDPLIRSYRWMLGCQRVICGLPWPLSGDLGDADHIERDVEVLATELPPVDTWHDAAGWADAERRLLMRFHLGVLRVAQDALHRGIFGGMLDVDLPTVATWENQIGLRRQDCVDRLVSMRLQGALSWRGEPPLWEGLFGFWMDAFNRGTVLAAVPTDVWRLIADRTRTFAALAAQVTWLAIRNGEPASQYFVWDTVKGPVAFRSWVGQDDESADDVARPSISVGLLLSGNDCAVRLSWSGLGEDGGATTPAPAGLAQAIRFATA